MKAKKPQSGAILVLATALLFLGRLALRHETGAREARALEIGGPSTQVLYSAGALFGSFAVLYVLTLLISPFLKVLIG